jgi:glucokinase
MVVLGVDIGGTKVAAAAVLASAQVKHKVVLKTPREGTADEVIQVIIDACSQVLAKSKCSAIAVALPGFTENGAIVFAGRTLRMLVDTNLKRVLEKKFSLPVSVFNDADCFAVAEHLASNATPTELTLGVIWGSGVGFGLVQGSKKNLIFPVGSRIELGHQPFGTLTIEQCAGGASLENRYFHMTGKKITLKQLYTMRKSDVLAGQFIERMIEAMIVSLTTAILSFAPDYIVLGGSVSKLPVLKHLQREVQKKLPEGISAPPIKRFTLGHDAGLVGAAQRIE